MKLNEFFTKHPVFTLDELDRFLTKRGTSNRITRNSLLSYYRKHGRVVSVRRGLYIVVSVGSKPETTSVDPFLLAGKLTPDAVLAYHTALEFHGKAYSMYERFFYTSNRNSVPVRFRNYQFQCVSTPRILQEKGKESTGVNKTERAGVELKVTGLERTFVDVLDRPDLSGTWEEIWRSLESVEFFDLDKVVEYTNLLENATTAAKVGFFLEQHRESLAIEEKYFSHLVNLRPKQPHYMERSKRKSGTLVSRWNLVVPRQVLERAWSEII
jgi:predicted transcriptional regulator of viral defense system